MKKNVYLIIISIALFVPLLFESGIFVNALSLNDLSYAKSENLIDPSNLRIVDQNLCTINNVYLPSVDDSLYLQLKSDYCNNYPYFTMTFYDVDFNEVLTVCEGGEEFENYGNTSWAICSIDPPRMNEISFSLCVSPIDDCDDLEELLFMCTQKGEYQEEYIKFEEAAGLIDISLTTPVIDIEYNYPLTIDDIKNLLVAVDAYDGDITRLLEIDASSYLQTPNKKGWYKIIVSVNDTNNNYQTGALYLNVTDKTPPSIAGPETIEYALYTNMTDELIISSYTASDEYDGDISQKIMVEGEYTTYPVGVYSEGVKLRIRDNSGNEYEKDITIKYFDNVPPTITCPDELAYSYLVNLSLEDIINENVSAIDNIVEDEVEISVSKDEYSGNERRVGKYIVEYVARDKSGNESKATMRITVSDEIKPVIFLNTYAIKVTDSVNLERLDFDNLLYAAGVLEEEKTYSATVLVDTYSGHENEAGMYIYSLKYTSTDGSEISKTFQIQVEHDSYTIDKNAKKQLAKETIELIVFIGVMIALLITSVIFLMCIKRKRKIK